jgi:hypothetical protein
MARPIVAFCSVFSWEAGRHGKMGWAGEVASADCEVYLEREMADGFERRDLLSIGEMLYRRMMIR